MYDENMNHIGSGERKGSEPKRHWTRGVHILVHDDKNILLQLRSSDKRKYPNLWDFSAGGGLLLGETTKNAAIREFQEELGIPWTFGDIKEALVVKMETMEDGTICNNFNSVFFLGKKLEPSELNLKKDEVEEIKHFPYNKFRDLVNSEKFVPYPKHYKKEILNYVDKYFTN